MIFETPPKPVVLAFLVSYLVIWLSRRYFSSFSRFPYPPGPRESNIITGNTSDLPNKHPWLCYTKWKEIYGDFVHFRVIDTHYFVINSLEIANELLGKRSAITSSRPRSELLSLMGWEFGVGFLRYGDRWRWHRRAYQKVFRGEAIEGYRNVQRSKVNDMLLGLLKEPEEFRGHCKTLAAGIMMKVLYDHDIAPTGDYFVELAEKSMAQLTGSAFMGMAAVALNFVPSLRYLPSWFPGASFQKIVKESLQLTNQLLTEPVQLVKRKTADGTIGNCVATQLLESSENSYDEHMSGEAAVNAYIAGSDTTMASLASFMATMARFPVAQQKAQEEIDRVIGQDRLPDFDDRSSLPYVEALCRELLRWASPVPLSIPRATIMDDVYGGFFIPKESTLIPNVWAMTRDPVRYPQPGNFDPARFLKADGTLNDDDLQYIFGFGRRLCPGRHLAISTLWLATVRTLALFNIHKKKDSYGREISVEVEPTDGIVSHPGEFECDIRPRKAEILRQLGTLS